MKCLLVIYWFLPSNSILPGGLLSSVWFYPKIYYHSNDYFLTKYFQPECNWYHVLCYVDQQIFFVNFTFSIRLLTVGCHDVGLDSSAVIFYKITLWYFYYTCKDIYCVFHFTKYLPNYRNDKIVNNSPSTCLEWMLFKMWYQQWLAHISPHCVSARAWNVISYWDISQTLTIFI